MSLSSDPSVSWQSQGNILPITTSIAGGATNSGNIVDVSQNSLGGWIQMTNTGGSSVSTTNGLQVLIYPAGDGTPHYDAIPMWTYTIPTTASTATPQSIPLPSGKYAIALKNLDATYAVTAGITSNPIA